jgi:adenylate kinase family enzyme
MPLEPQGPRRIVIVGASASGKTTLALALADSLRIQVIHLDEVAREGGGTGQVRSTEDKEAAVGLVLANEAWIAEGIHVGWTDPLLDAADLVIWLDHVSWPASTARRIMRFTSQALAEMRRQKGLRKIARVRDYKRRLRELLAAIPESRNYHRSSAVGLETREGTARRMATLGNKVIHIQRQGQIDELKGRLASRST